MEKIQVRLARFQKNGVMYIFAEKRDVPSSSIHWNSGFQQEPGTDLVRFDTRQKYENQHWANDVPVLNAPVSIFTRFGWAEAQIDDRGNIELLHPSLENGCSLSVF